MKTGDIIHEIELGVDDAFRDVARVFDWLFSTHAGGIICHIVLLIVILGLLNLFWMPTHGG